MSSEEHQKERSRLLNRQKAERSAAEKALKKLKGDMKEKAQKELEEMEARHAAELAEMDGTGGKGDSKKTTEKETLVYFRNQNWYIESTARPKFLGFILSLITSCN